MSRARDLSNLLSTGSGTQTYATIAELPLTDNNTGAQAFVSENNRLYIWSGTGWYNIALVNTTPTAITGAASDYIFATDGTPIEITLISTDPEGIPITWSYSVTSGSLTNGGGTTATVSQAANVFTITPTTNENYIGEFSLTFTASDGVNLATATSSFTLTFAILNSRYTALLVKAESSGSNTTFVDSSTNNFAITRTGDVTQGTFSPYSRPEGEWSNYFGTGKLEIADSTNLNVFDGDYTIECWAYSEVSQTTSSGIAGKGGSATGWTLNVTGTTLLVSYGGTTGLLTSSSGLFTVGVWHHVAVCRSGSTINLFCDGVIIDTVTRTTNDNTTNILRIGANRIDSDKFQGYISNFRIVGSALYTANFTPPTDPLTVVANTSILTCQSNRFVDTSTNNFAITVSGNTTVTAFSPYDQLAYDPVINGGSAYFDGSGDYLTSNSSNEFTANVNGFTVECWVYYTSISNYSFIVASTTGANNYNPYWYIGSTNTGNWRISWGDAASVDTGVVIKTNSWNHVAMSMASNGSGTFYVNGTSIATTTGKTLNGAATAVAIAHGGGSLAGQYLVSGYIADLRYVKSSVYTANFTPPTAPLTAVTGTSLLLKCDNGNIVDYSGNNNLAVLGNTTVNTTTTKYAAGSIYFDGSGDYLTASPDSGFQFGTGNFTIEGWVYILETKNNGIFQQGTSFFPLSTTNSVALGTNGGGSTWQMYAKNTNINSTVTYTTNSWYHFAVVRSGTTTTFYLNGTAAITVTADTTNYTGTYFGIGSIYSAGNNINGYIEDLRITKGLARYTANFTPPTSELRG